MSNEFHESAVPETADAKPEVIATETGAQSDTGKLSIQGFPPDDVAGDMDQQPDQPENPEPDVPDAQEEKFPSSQETTDTSRPIPDHSFIDEKGRDITLRTWEAGDRIDIRGYETGKESVPDTIDRGTVGRANTTLEHQQDGSTRLRLNDIEVEPPYRRAGTGEQMLDQVEQHGRNHDAKEVYGSIDSEDAHNFWEKQARNGWQIRESNSYYGDAYKPLK